MSNGVFWGLLGANEFFQFWQIVEPKHLIFLLIPLSVVLGVGLIYGLGVGVFLSARCPGRSWLFHPGVQALFQPFWFMVMMTAGCLCAVPIGLVVETVSFLADQQ